MEDLESPISIERLESISQKRKIGTFASASKIQQIRACGEWIIKVCKVIINIDKVSVDMAEFIQIDIISIHSAFQIQKVQDRDLVKFGQEIGKAFVEISFVLIQFKREVTLDEVARAAATKCRLSATLECTTYLLSAFEYIRIYLDPSETIDSTSATKQSGISPATPAPTPKDTTPETPKQLSISDPDRSSKDQLESKGNQPTSFSTDSTTAAESEAKNTTKSPATINEWKLKNAMVKFRFPQSDIEDLCDEFDLPYDQVQDPDLRQSIKKLFQQAHLKGVHENLIQKILGLNSGLKQKGINE